MKYPAHPLTSDQAARLLDACGRGWVATRNRALLVLLYRAGLRCSEALDLELDDLRLEISTGGERLGVVRVERAADARYRVRLGRAGGRGLSGL